MITVYQAICTWIRGALVSELLTLCIRDGCRLVLIAGQTQMAAVRLDKARWPVCAMRSGRALARP